MKSGATESEKALSAGTWVGMYVVGYEGNMRTIGNHRLGWVPPVPFIDPFRASSLLGSFL